MKKSPWKLDPLFTPRSIAVIGASPNGGAGSIVLRNMQRLGYTGTVYPINPKYKEIFGYPCYASLRDLPAPADCAAVLLGSRSLLPMLEEAHAAGVKGVWGFASGFAETGGEGRAMQRRIHDFCHESGLLFCGPNCVGYANITDKTCMYSAPLPQAFRPGDIGVIAQSGAVLLALGNANRMAGFSRLISSGNEAALGLADYMDYLVDDDATHVIALFIETIRDPEAFAAACSRAAEKGKPVIALKVGRSELACRVAATHTGAIAGSDRILDAFFRRANVMRVNTLDDLLETAVLFSGLRSLSAGSPKVGMATVSGGEMGMLADVCADSGLVFPPISEAGKERLRKVLPPYAPIANPLDAWGSGDLREAYPASLGILAAEEDVETLIVSQDIPGNMAPEQVEQFSDVARAGRRRARRLRQAGHRRFQYLRRHRSCHRRYPRTGQCPRGAGQRRGHPRRPALDRLVRRARGENGISLPPEGFLHSFHTPPRTGFGTRRQFGRIALRAFRPPAAPFRDRHRSRGACGFA